MKDYIKNTYGGKTRVRVCGICIKNDSILLVNHKGLSRDSFWSPPGGGLNYLEDSESALKREFLEETGLTIKVKRLLFVNEHLSEPLHAIELFFEVEIISGELRIGFDPEHSNNEQIISDVEFVTFKKLSIISDEEKHKVLQNVINKESLLNMRGYFHFS